MFQLGLLVVGMFLLQAALSGLQMRHFSKEFVQLRRRGKVACGRKTLSYSLPILKLNSLSCLKEGLGGMSPYLPPLFLHTLLGMSVALPLTQESQ